MATIRKVDGEYILEFSGIVRLTEAESNILAMAGASLDMGGSDYFDMVFIPHVLEEIFLMSTEQGWMGLSNGLNS